MQRYFISEDQINNNTVSIKGSDVHHIMHVMRKKVGDKVEVVTYEGKLYLVSIVSINKEMVVCEIEKSIFTEYKPINLVLGVALIKRDNFELVLKKTTELGVKGILPLETERSIVKIKDFDKKTERYNAIFKESSEQSERTILPLLYDYSNLENINIDAYDYLFFGDARDESNLLNIALKKYSSKDSVLFLIGPEGGFSEKEAKLLIKKGFKPVSLGSTILRAETAAIAVASIFNYLRGSLC